MLDLSLLFEDIVSPILAHCLEKILDVSVIPQQSDDIVRSPHSVNTDLLFVVGSGKDLMWFSGLGSRFGECLNL
jgi:hypothetical protein